MKKSKRFLVLLVALSVIMCMTAFAGEIESVTGETAGVTAEVLESKVAFDLRYSGATDGGMYLVLVLSDEGVPTANNILYVNQVTASDGVAKFDNVYPKEVAESYVYLAGTDMAYSKVAKVNLMSAEAVVKGDLDKNGNIDIDDVLLCLDLCFVTPSAEDYAVADLDVDGDIDIDDVLLCLDLCF